MPTYRIRIFSVPMPTKKSGDKEAAVNNYELIAATPEAEPTVSSLRGFALAKLGRVSEAEVWIQNIL